MNNPMWYAALTLCASSLAAAQQISSFGVPPGGGTFVPVAVSADGQVVLGNWQGSRAMLWTPTGGFESLSLPAGWTYTVAYALSADGTTIVGDANISGLRAFRWTRAGGYQNLGVVPGGGHSLGRGVNADGTVVVGQASDSTTNYKAMRWTVAGGMRALPSVPGTISDATAYAVSGDGAIVVGETYTSGGYRAFRWTSGTGSQSLGVLPGTNRSWALNISRDGAVITGTSTDNARLFRWTAPTGMIDLGYPAGANATVYTPAISSDGSVFAVDPWGVSYPHASIWTSFGGFADLNTFLPPRGVDLSGWTLSHIAGMSADGRTMVGQGPHGATYDSWIVTLQCLVGPGIVTNPGSMTLCAGTRADFTVVPSGTGPFRYSWRKDHAPINVADNPSAATATLVLNAISTSDIATYDCVVSNDCGSITSNGAALAICACLSCPADFNQDGGIDGSDIDDFFTAWVIGHCDADVNGDGGIDGADVDTFFAAWENGGCDQ